MKKHWMKSFVLSVTFVLLAQGTSSAVYAAAAPSPSPTPAPAPAGSQADPSLNINAKSVVLMDAASGQLLYQQNPDEELPPASMAKMMTEYLVLDNIQKGKIHWDDMVPIDEYSAKISQNKGLSGISKAQGDTYSVKDLFYAVTIYSDNGAAISLGEHIAGSDEKFAQLMNETAAKIGLSKDAHFINASGLDRVDLGPYAPTSIQGETQFTARDAAMIAFHLLHDHKEILDYSKINAKKFRPTDESVMVNWNWMLESNANVPDLKQYAYQGLDGLKTGHTDRAGYCFTGTAERNGMRLISVIMGSPTRQASFIDTKRILDYGFTNFEIKQVIQPKTTIDTLQTVSVRKGVETSVPVVTEAGITFVAKKGAKDEEFTKVATANDASKIVAPIKQGDVLGTLTVTYNNTSQKVNLVAAKDVQKGSWIRLFFRAIGHMFGDLFKSIKKLI